jgi:hypothetical protein
VSPRVIEDLVELGNRYFTLLLAARGVEYCERGAAVDDGRDRDLLTGRVPSAGRVDELQAGEMRVARGARQLVHDLPGLAVGEKEIGGEDAARR